MLGFRRILPRTRGRCPTSTPPLQHANPPTFHVPPPLTFPIMLSRNPRKPLAPNRSQPVVRASQTSRAALRRRLLSLMLVVAASSLGCDHRSTGEWSLPIDVPEVIGERRRIEPIRTHLGLTGRSVLACPAGYCVILHYPPAPVDIEDLTDVLEGDPASDEDNGELYYDPNSRWCTAAAMGEARNTFNCCTFAVGDVAGLTPEDWIVPIPSGDAFNTLPMDVILNSYYQRVQAIEGPRINWQAIERDDSLQTDDVLCYVRTTDQYVCYTHVGKIWKQDGRNWLISKFGAGPIIRATVEATGQGFSGEFDKIWIYRQKAD